jgi:pantoate--beta-alanine ligase
MKTVVTAAELNAEIEAAKAAGKKVAFVPTMGALHQGHLSLIELAKKHAEFVVVSIFVNPLQFGPSEDFDKYPRTLETDSAQLAEAGVDLLFTPTVEVIYPKSPEPTKSAGPIGEILEGAVRPGHFDGMLTVVSRLFDLVQPNVAVFGAKDAQQLHLIKAMATRDYPNLKIIEAATIRETGGLALSSRNRYLDEAAHEVAQQLSAALRSGAAAVHPGSQTNPNLAIEAARAVLAKAPEAKLEYIALVDQDTFEPIENGFSGRALLLIAARVGETRLIDNTEITF